MGDASTSKPRSEPRRGLAEQERQPAPPPAPGAPGAPETPTTDRAYPLGAEVSYVTGARVGPPVAIGTVVGPALRDVHTDTVWVPVRPLDVPIVSDTPPTLVRGRDIIDVAEPLPRN